jgi:hypothetical protein
LEGLVIESVGIFNGQLVYFTAIWYILWLFGIFYGHWLYFVVIWYIFPRLYQMLHQEKSGNPASAALKVGARGTVRRNSAPSVNLCPTSVCPTLYGLNLFGVKAGSTR